MILASTAKDLYKANRYRTSEDKFLDALSLEVERVSKSGWSNYTVKFDSDNYSLQFATTIREELKKLGYEVGSMQCESEIKMVKTGWFSKKAKVHTTHYFSISWYNVYKD